MSFAPRRVTSLVLASLVLASIATSCNCGGRGLVRREDCDFNPELCDAGVPDAGPDDAGTPPDAGPCPATGTITGRVCAPDQRTWVNGAAVTIDATDCHGQPVQVKTTSQANGYFTLPDVPAGAWTLHATLGAFSQDTAVKVTEGTTTSVPENQLCVEQKTVKIAVVTGFGDHIEDLLDQLNLDYTLIAGDTNGWKTEGSAFFSNLDEMKKYDLIFIDCAAARGAGTTISFGPASSKIRSNLAAYVQAGGSIYGSDWALLFAVYAAPGSFSFYTYSGNNITDPLETTQLMGYAPQTVSAQILDSNLSAFLGKSTVPITFPKQSGAMSLHWGLMKQVAGAQVLASASQVISCNSTQCNTEGNRRNDVPLAVRVKVTPAGTRGGNVVYTSFHNGGQAGNDVAQILKYLVLNL